MFYISIDNIERRRKGGLYTCVILVKKRRGKLPSLSVCTWLIWEQVLNNTNYSDLSCLLSFSKYKYNHEKCFKQDPVEQNINRKTPGFCSLKILK